MIIIPGSGWRGAGGVVVSYTYPGSAQNVGIAGLFPGVAEAPYAGQTLILYLAPGIIIGATTTADSALQTQDGGWHPSWIGQTIQIGVLSGTSRIQGCGGAAGRGARRSDRRYGGGGGGCGYNVGAGADAFGQAGTPETGGTGYWSSTVNSGPSQAAVNGAGGGIALAANAGGPNILLAPSAGATLQVWGGGGGGGGGDTRNSPGITYPGGNGGGPGLAGASVIGTLHGGVVLSVGGPAGSALYTPGSATITVGGAGTVDIRG